MESVQLQLSRIGLRGAPRCPQLRPEWRGEGSAPGEQPSGRSMGVPASSLLPLPSVVLCWGKVPKVRDHWGLPSCGLCQLAAKVAEHVEQSGGDAKASWAAIMIDDVWFLVRLSMNCHAGDTADGSFSFQELLGQYRREFGHDPEEGATRLDETLAQRA